MENNRDHQLLHLRPEIPTINYQTDMTGEEAFQNTILRPILKLQNELLLNIFRQYLIEKKVDLRQMSQEKREEYIQTAVQKDTALRGMIQGCIIGHFTAEEWQLFSLHKKELGRRLTTMAIQRLQSQTALLASVS